jgi:2-dehydro-3-deoxyphosphooctonate aldolase (KDO 8-P synthase)
MDVAGQLKEITAELGIPFIFKSSYDKANRSSGKSFRGPGMEKGLEILAKVKKTLNVPVLTDVHTAEEVPDRGAVRRRAARRPPSSAARPTSSTRWRAPGKPVNIKKGQFLAPSDMKKRRRQGARGERHRQHHGVRARGVLRLQQPGLRHALARDHARHRLPGGLRRDALGAAPGGQGTSSGGQREFVPVLARAAVATGVAGVFMETHPDPAKALSDGPTPGRSAACASSSPRSRKSTRW